MDIILIMYNESRQDDSSKAVLIYLPFGKKSRRINLFFASLD